LITGCRVALDELKEDGATVELRFGRRSSERRTIRWLVDATGARRILLRQAGVPVETREDPLLKGEGVEWLLEADDRRSAPWRDRLSFFLGSRWVFHGYGWVFPMDQHRLKVGICRLPPPSSTRVGGLGSCLKRLIRHCDLDSLTVLDRHGGLVSSPVRREQSLGRGSLLAVGDAAGTCNLLGGEGLRHALRSADLLAAVLSGERAIPLKRDSLITHYSSRLRQVLGWRWGISGRLARRTWWGLDASPADRRMLRLIDALSRNADAKDLSQLLFDYKFERYGPRLLPYVI
jgi:flavin-dependent dehydrogenase